jgi:hypothetical protein
MSYTVYPLPRPYVFMAWCVVKRRGNFTSRLVDSHTALYRGGLNDINVIEVVIGKENAVLM